ncbi:phosphotransferase [Winogradskya humida]|uniref:Aminoglycoside phosphotransferase domain-containing protein n=1 Tax=Winogradskya humida TaxID=113566 RepID=A0ABQ3ZPU2_9ACTN|nr:phosphotransferase [Actinoplanes humidus]GIE20600.1 hypothetical protein Ahu01nite_037020 [Actinoplanes humidus]
MTRIVTLVLTDTSGNVLGSLPPFELGLPWWQETADVAEAVRERHGLAVTVLRLLSAGHPAPPGGEVTYLAQIDEHLDDAAEPFDHTAGAGGGAGEARAGGGAGEAGAGGGAGEARAGVALKPYEVDLQPSPLRAPWAVPGGPGASLRWALPLCPGGASAVQIRTWNLSAIWRIDVGGTPAAWLKQVPIFAAHEPAVLRLVAEIAPGLVPAVLATGDAGRSLLSHAPGEDRYGAGPDFCAAVARTFHPVQEHFATHIGTLLDAGIPDRRLAYDRFARVAEPWLDHLDGLDDLLDELPARLAAIAACGLPDTLIHGDLHPGNVRSPTTPDQSAAEPGAAGSGAAGSGATGSAATGPGATGSGAAGPGAAGGVVIVDWADSAVGHPALDIVRLGQELPAGSLVAEWAARWRAAVPGSDPETALELIRPVAALASAALYQDFIDHIEESERPYHESDVPELLRAAVDATRPTPRADHG